MYKPIRSLIFLLLMVPTVVLAQQRAQAPCPQVLAVAHAAPVTAIASANHRITETIPQGTSVADVQFSAEKRKTFEKTYKVNSSDMLAIENKFGKVHINTWNKSEIQVKVDMISRANSEQKAEEQLDKIGLKESHSGNLLSLKTELQPINMTGNNSRGIEINYTVYMPDNISLTVNNSFGDVYLASLKGKTDITVKYGSLKTNGLSNASNAIKLSFGSGSCGYVNGGTVDVSYASFSLEGTKDIQGSSKYSEFKIGDLEQVLDLDVKYGSLRVDNISKNVRKINLAGGFSPITLRFEDNSAFNFDVNVQFGSFKFNENQVNVTSLERSHTKSEYKGRFGNNSSNASISIVSKYGDVRFSN